MLFTNIILQYQHRNFGSRNTLNIKNNYISYFLLTITIMVIMTYKINKKLINYKIIIHIIFYFSILINLVFFPSTFSSLYSSIHQNLIVKNK